MIHVFEATRHAISHEYLEELSQWSTNLVKHVLKLLDLEAGPAVEVMLETLVRLGTTTPYSGRKNRKTVKMNTPSSSPDTGKNGVPETEYALENFLNAQPAKNNFLSVCDSFLREDVLVSFKKVHS